MSVHVRNSGNHAQGAEPGSPTPTVPQNAIDRGRISIDTGSFFGLVAHTCSRLIDAIRAARSDYIANTALKSLDFSSLKGIQSIEDLNTKLESYKAGLPPTASECLERSLGAIGIFQKTQAAQISGKYLAIASILQKAGFSIDDKQHPSTWPTKAMIDATVKKLTPEEKLRFVQSLPKLQGHLDELGVIHDRIESALIKYVGATHLFVGQVAEFEQSEIYLNTSSGAGESFRKAVETIGEALAIKLAPLLEGVGSGETLPDPTEVREKASAALSHVIELAHVDHSFRNSGDYKNLSLNSVDLYSVETNSREAVFSPLCQAGANVRGSDFTAVMDQIPVAAARSLGSLKSLQEAVCSLDNLEKTSKVFLDKNSDLNEKAQKLYESGHGKIIDSLLDSIDRIVRDRDIESSAISEAIHTALEKAGAEAVSLEEKTVQLSEALKRADDISRKLDSTVAYLAPASPGSLDKQIEHGKVYVHLSDKVADSLLEWVKAERTGPQALLEQALSSSTAEIDTILKSVEQFQVASARIHDRLGEVGKALLKVSKKMDRDESNDDPFKNDPSQEIIVKRMTTSAAFVNSSDSQKQGLESEIRQVFATATKLMEETIITSFQADTARINSGGAAASSLKESLKPLVFCNRTLDIFEERMKTETTLRSSARSILDEVTEIKARLEQVRLRAVEIMALGSRNSPYGKPPTWNDFE